MHFTEKLLRCIDCHKNFTFTVAEQELHASHGFINEPIRCPTCRRAKKSMNVRSNNDFDDFRPQSKMFPVNCTQCGKVTRVPFQPHEGKAVYCSDCFYKVRVSK